MRILMPLAFTIALAFPVSADEMKARSLTEGLVGEYARMHLRTTYNNNDDRRAWKHHYRFVQHLVSEGVLIQEIPQKTENPAQNSSKECEPGAAFCITLQEHKVPPLGGARETYLAATDSDWLVLKTNGNFTTLFVGVYDVISVIWSESINRHDCQWKVKYRAWMEKDGSPIANAYAQYTGFDGYVAENCYYKGRDGLVWKFHDVALPK
ncbi:hypothetical protein [Leisingera sp. ANG59]|uniref:hypothetical protein n=1 Tax=Leisingera sp. ANG59 TaxID=2675221 RepID=UPI001572D521|nr:hypothetical protein [Leisingera sp. ANG59]NSY37539.1 hypothetical protein [Leisingera sp. ANG59]